MAEGAMKPAVLFLFLTLPLFAANEILDNAAIVKLASAGLAPDVIVLKIQRSQTAFDTTTDALIALKNAHVPDVVIGSMVLKTDAPAPPPPAPTPPPAAPPPPAPPIAASTCAMVRFYSLGTGGWAWSPSYVCVSESGVSIDEEHIALKDLTVHCISKPLSIHADQQEWWLGDKSETFKFQGKTDDLERLSRALAHAKGSVPHGDCGSRDVRRLLAR
jgi:hypothetical protein